MTFSIKSYFISLLLLSFLLFGSCGFYSLNPAGSTGDAKTVSIDFFPNKSSLVNPDLSQQFTELLRDKFVRDTRLSLVKEEGDFQLSGFISSYYVSPAAIQGDEGTPLNRLTMSVRVKFVNKTNDKLNFEQEFSNFGDFPSTTTLSAVERVLAEDVSNKIIQEIFNRTVINW